MRPVIVSGIVTGDAPVSYWLVFSLSPVIVPEFFAKVSLPSFSSFLNWRNSRLGWAIEILWWTGLGRSAALCGKLTLK